MTCFKPVHAQPQYDLHEFWQLFGCQVLSKRKNWKGDVAKTGMRDLCDFGKFKECDGLTVRTIFLTMKKIIQYRRYWAYSDSEIARRISQHRFMLKTHSTGIFIKLLYFYSTSFKADLKNVFENEIGALAKWNRPTGEWTFCNTETWDIRPSVRNENELYYHKSVLRNKLVFKSKTVSINHYCRFLSPLFHTAWFLSSWILSYFTKIESKIL